MAAEQVNLAMAFVAGLLSFLSPCVLPLVPAYIGHLAGTTSPEAVKSRRLSSLGHGLAFVLGFTVVFVSLWALVGVIGDIVRDFKGPLQQAGGAVLIFFGLHVAEVIRLPFLYQERRMHLDTGSRASLPVSFVVGVVFAAGWTPCIGPVLAAIIGLATMSDTVAQGALLLIVYSLGLGVPFLIAAVALDKVWGRLGGLTRYGRAVSIVSGALLVVVGLLMITKTLHLLSQFLPYWEF